MSKYSLISQHGRLSRTKNDPQILMKRLQKLAPNMQIKFPVTQAGLVAIEQATTQGLEINATVSFTVAQAISVAEGVERGLAARTAAGLSVERTTPVCTIMVGRLDDWLRTVAERENIVVDPDIFDWAGVAVAKQAYRIYQERKYKTRLLIAAYRCHYHWSQFISGDIVLSIPPKWQRLFNDSGIPVNARMEDPVAPRVLQQLLERFEDFRKAYSENGLQPPDFESYQPTRRTLRQFIDGYTGLVKTIRNVLLPDPDR